MKFVKLKKLVIDKTPLLVGFPNVVVSKSVCTGKYPVGSVLLLNCLFQYDLYVVSLKSFMIL